VGERPLVVVPTYNEAENIEPLVMSTLKAAPDADLLIVDDNSPDGTGEIGARMANRLEAVHILHRPEKQGLGSAYVEGFNWALNRGYPAIVQMDADGSHGPDEVPKLLKALDLADVALGSRWVPGGRAENWPRRRALLSRSGNAYVRHALGLPLRDATGGFRAYRRRALEQLELEQVASKGYCFQVDVADRAVDAGMSAVEVPITFHERKRGRSKMSPAIIVEAFLRVTGWIFTRRARRAALGIAR
jgi:dolichol-phosphate mannosyltransferase